MNRRITTVFGVACVVTLVFSVNAWAEKFAFVDLATLAQKSVRFQQMQKRLKNLYDKKRAELERKKNEIIKLTQELQKQGPMLKEETRKVKQKQVTFKELELKMAEQEAKNLLQNSQREQQVVVNRDIRKIIGQLRKKHNFSMVFNAMALFSANDALDITDQVIKIYDQSAGAKAPAPRPARPAPKKKAQPKK